LLARLVFHNLKQELRARVERRARRHGRSTKGEVCEILPTLSKTRALKASKQFGSRLRARFAGIGLEDELPEVGCEHARQEIRGCV
jgi:antitoxin FitA